MTEAINQVVLTNEERPYFGLDAVLPQWECVEIKPGFLAYFDGEIIRKTISYRTLSGAGYENFLEYIESDHEICTRERLVVLPRTERGKEKKLNYTSISAMKPTGCIFQMNLAYPNQSSTLLVMNARNTISLPIPFPQNVDTLEAFRQWLAGFIKTCPENYWEKVARMKNTPHRTIKYGNGDIFRFEIDLEHYGFGLIIGQINKMRKDGLLQEEHLLCATMGVPLLVRLYQFQTTKKDLTVEEITQYPLGKTFIMMDNHVIWGVYDLVGSKPLEASDIDFPIQAGRSIDAQDPDYVCLCWGTGLIVRRKAADFPPALADNSLMRHSVHFGVGRGAWEQEMAGKAEKGLDELEQIAFSYFGIPLTTTFDAFNQAHGGMTRGEYAAYANKSRRKL